MNDKLLSDVIDGLYDIKPKVRLKHAESLTKNQKRAVRKGFNEIQGQIVEETDKKMQEFMFYGSTTI